MFELSHEVCVGCQDGAEEGWAFRQRLQHCVQRPEGRRERVLFVRSLGCARKKATVGEKECLVVIEEMAVETCLK